MNRQATQRMTMAQAVIAFLKNQYVERDGQEQAFFAGCFGIFGHGNIAGIGQALQEMPEFRYYQARNEQAMVHSATAYAKTRNRLCKTYADFSAALKAVQSTDTTTVIYIRNDRYVGIPNYESWWDVPVAEVSTMPQVEKAHAEWAEMRSQERYFLER